MNDKTAPLSPVAADPPVMRRLLINLYNTAYHAGHEDTVEGRYTDVLPCDMSTYHEDVVDVWVAEYLENDVSARNEENDICGLCGKPGAEKFAHPEHWPGERIPDGPLVHAQCEEDECARAHAALTDEQRHTFLRTI